MPGGAGFLPSTCLNLRFASLFFEAELDLTHSDQRRVLHILWCIAEKERIENLQDVVSWVQKSVCFFVRCCLEKGGLMRCIEAV